MKALFFDGSLRLLDNYPDPTPGENEALIRVLIAGLCGTDMEITRGYRGFKGVPGHEFVGVVEQVRGDRRDLLGKRVVGEINCGCGECDCCRKGLEKHCTRRTVTGISGRDGVFAEYVTLPLKNLWTVPDNTTDEEIVFVEPLAAVYEILEQVHIRPTDSVLILGDGRLGLLTALTLARRSDLVVLAGQHAEKLGIAAVQGVETKKTEELQEERVYDVIVEATGSANGLEMALRLIQPRGTIVLKSTIAASIEADLSVAVINEVAIVGSRCGPFAPAIAAISTRSVMVKPLISAVYPFSMALEAFEKARSRDSIKVLLDFRDNR